MISETLDAVTKAEMSCDIPHMNMKHLHGYPSSIVRYTMPLKENITDAQYYGGKNKKWTFVKLRGR